jgi:hypothetical protein
MQTVICQREFWTRMQEIIHACSQMLLRIRGEHYESRCLVLSLYSFSLEHIKWITDHCYSWP